MHGGLHHHNINPPSIDSSALHRTEFHVNIALYKYCLKQTKLPSWGNLPIYGLVHKLHQCSDQQGEEWITSNFV